jgi:hypothetical protein
VHSVFPAVPTAKLKGFAQKWARPFYFYMTNRVLEALNIVVRVCALGEYDSNVIGMAAEIIAEDMFGMTKTPRGTRHIDGTWMKDGLNQTIQVKAWSEARVTKYKNGTFLRLKETALPDELLVLLIYSSMPGYEIIYKGSPKDVGYVETSKLTRAIRFDTMKSREEISEILERLQKFRVSKGDKFNSEG